MMPMFLMVNLAKPDQKFVFERDLMLDEASASLKVAASGEIYCFKLLCHPGRQWDDFNPTIAFNGSSIYLFRELGEKLKRVATKHPDVEFLFDEERHEICGLMFSGDTIVKQLAILQQ